MTAHPVQGVDLEAPEPRDPWEWLHDNDFSWDDVNAIAAVLDAGGFDISVPARAESEPGLRKVMEAVPIHEYAETEDNFEGLFIGYIVDAELLDALRAALAATPADDLGAAPDGRDAAYRERNAVVAALIRTNGWPAQVVSLEGKT